MIGAGRAKTSQKDGLLFSEKTKCSKCGQEAPNAVVVLDLLVLSTLLAKEQKVSVILAFVRAENVAVGIDFVKNAGFLEVQQISVDGNPIDGVGRLRNSVNQFGLTETPIRMTEGK